MMLHEVQTETLRALIRAEVRLKAEQGFAVDTWEPRAETASYPALLELEQELQTCAEPELLATSEPLDWVIPRSTTETWIPKPGELRNRLEGAWRGRIAGCILGKPLEIGPVFQDVTLCHQYLKRTSQYPLSDFVVADEQVAQEVFGQNLGCPLSWKDRITFAESDDDLRYSFAGVDILEKVGPDFSTADVYAWWAAHLPPDKLFTAEQAVYANTYRLSPQGWSTKDWSEAHWDFVRRYRNPYREFIGAAIRADGWAYCAAGDPFRAATFAQRDARLSHERNGEYSEIFFAAWIAGAFRWSIEESLANALRKIPGGSRLANAVLRTVDYCGHRPSFEESCGFLHEQFGSYDGVHAINNATACVAAVLLAGGDFERGITQAVMFGWDTDCNGATVGSILGANLGLSNLPSEKWFAPFQDRIDLEVGRDGEESITDLISKTERAWQRLSSP